MKKMMLAALALSILAGCSVFAPPVAAPYHSFVEVSQPYLDQYGAPEEVNKYTSDDYSTIDWWWWTQGIEVTFSNTSYDNVSGWKVDSEYTFVPIP